MILGLSMSHDSSAALTTPEGKVIAAIGEERITRVKNHSGIPTQSIELILDTYSNGIELVVFGTHSTLSVADSLNFISLEENNPSGKRGYYAKTYPGFLGTQNLINPSAKDLITSYLKNRFPKLKGAEFKWENHHDSHLGCALGVFNSSNDALLVSLDGDGDGESGAISQIQSGSLKSLSRFGELDSLGHLYSAVTERYNFKATRHEGKITGLAAFGKHSEAVDILLQFINVNNGQIRIKSMKNFQSRIIKLLGDRIGFKSKIGLRLSEIVDLAESKTTNYPDLAFAVQNVLESSVCEIIDFWRQKTLQSNIGLAGGVFANVKLNQKISQIEGVKSVRIFPNMGDGGTSLGAIWSHLYNLNSLAKDELFENMYLAPPTIDLSDQELQDYCKNNFLQMEFFEDQILLYHRAAHLLDQNYTVAVHEGRMEFGPRALGNRTLLVNPRFAENMAKVNNRLQRTEFMPFAPIVLAEFASRYFDITTDQDLYPFKYMTMTCNVQERYAAEIPAVVHVDFTARPQIVSEKSNFQMYSILKSFHNFTGIPVLVNTSLNIHEQPINFKIQDSLKALQSDSFDYLIYKNYLIYRN